MCVMSMQPKEAEERVGLLELQLLMAVSCHLGPGNRTWLLCRDSCALNHQTAFLALQ